MPLDDDSILLLSSIGTSPTAWVSVSALGRSNQTKRAFSLYTAGYLTTQIMNAETHYGLTSKAATELDTIFKGSPDRIPDNEKLLFRAIQKRPNPANGAR